MNLTAILSFTVLALAAGGSNLYAKDLAQTEPDYAASTHKDIDKVVRIEESLSSDCEIVPAKMTYLDSHNQIHEFTYKKWSEVCAATS